MQIYLAPMEGITTFIYRNAFEHYYGGIDKYFTPFLSNRSLNYKDINDVCPEHNHGLPVVPQILTNQADVFLSIASQLADYGYKEVNLNLGCPSGTVVARKRGAGFLSIPETLASFLEEIFEKCPLEISIKTRIGIGIEDLPLDESLKEWETLLSIYAKYPLKELIIHPRFQKEFYNGKPHPEAFRLAQDTLNMPLCYNGDITSKETLDTFMSQMEPVETIMLGRGVIANPELARGLIQIGNDSIAKMQSDIESSSVSLLPKDRKTFRAFHDEILEGYIELMSGEQPVLFRMKEVWVYMRKYAELTDKEFKQIQKSKRIAEYKGIVQSIL